MGYLMALLSYFFWAERPSLLQKAIANMVAELLKFSHLIPKKKNAAMFTQLRTTTPPNQPHVIIS